MTDYNPKSLESLLGSSPRVFLKIWKKGCGPCKLSTSAIERLEKTWGDKVHFAQISASDHPEMLDIAETEVLPIFVSFENGRLVGKLEGFKGLQTLENFISKSFPKASH